MSESDPLTRDEEETSLLDLVRTGRFTLDSAAVLELRKHQLADPDHYVLPIVSAAILGGAKSIDVGKRFRTCHLSFDGLPFTVEQLDGLLGSLFARSDDRARKRMRELAIGINAALGLEPRHLSIESWDGSSGSRLTWAGEGLTVERLSEPPWAGGGVMTRIRLQRRDWRLFRLQDSRIRLWPSEPGAVSDHFAFAPSSICITANGKRVNPPIDVGGCVAWSHLMGENGEANLSFGPPKAPVQRTLASPGPFSAVVAIGAGSWSSGGWPRYTESRIAFVLNGQSFFESYPDGSDHDIRAVVCAPGLQTDLSRAKIIKNEAYAEVMAILGDEVREMMDELARRLGVDSRTSSSTDWLTAFPGGSLGILQKVAENYRARGLLKAAIPLYEEAAERKKRQGDLEEDYGGEGTYDLAAILHRAAHFDEALRALEELWVARKRKWRWVSEYAILDCKAMVYLDQGRLDEAERLAERALARSRRLVSLTRLAGLTDILHLIENLATVYVARGKRQAAEKLLARALKYEAREDRVDRDRHLGTTFEGLTRLYLALERPHEAKPVCEQWLALCEKDDQLN